MTIGIIAAVAPAQSHIIYRRRRGSIRRYRAILIRLHHHVPIIRLEYGIDSALYPSAESLQRICPLFQHTSSSQSCALTVSMDAATQESSIYMYWFTWMTSQSVSITSTDDGSPSGFGQACTAFLFTVSTGEASPGKRWTSEISLECCRYSEIGFEIMIAFVHDKRVIFRQEERNNISPAKEHNSL